MRFYEIANKPLPPTQGSIPANDQQPPDNNVQVPSSTATNVTVPADQPAEPLPVYADEIQLKDAITFLTNQLPNGTFKLHKATGTKQVHSIRARGISPDALDQAMIAYGATVGSPDSKQSTASSAFDAYSFDKDNVLYTVVIGMKGLKKGTKNAGIARKELTPAGLGIQGRNFNKNELITATKQAVESKIKPRDPVLADALIALVDNAATGGTRSLTPEQITHIQPFLGTLSQDFGEILAPIMVMKKGDKAEFPTGNHPLVDVKMPGMNLSVKSLSGSGTSFRSISNLMDKYEKSIENDPVSKQLYGVIRQMHPSTGGSNKDKIVRAAAAANIPEYKKLIQILGVAKLNSFDDLAAAVKSKTGSEDYKTFLKTFYPMMIAGPWGKPVGLPADGMYYLGKTDKVKKEKSAGYPSYRVNPVTGGADIITYSMGVGLLNEIRKGSNSEKYKEMMTKIVREADAVLGHITVTKNGSIELKIEPFSNLKFEFQYHAPSHIPGNNLPGFIAVM